MSTLASTEYQKLLPQLTVTFGVVERHLAEASRALARGGAEAARDRGGNGISAELGALEHTALAMAREEVADEPILAVLRMAGHLRSVDRLATELGAVRPFGASEVPEELSDHLHHMSELAITQLATAQQALLSGDGEAAVSAHNQDVDLDGMFDLLLSDCLEDLAAKGDSSIPLRQVLQTARLLERIGGYAVSIAEDAVELTAHLVGRTAH